MANAIVESLSLQCTGFGTSRRRRKPQEGTHVRLNPRRVKRCANPKPATNDCWGFSKRKSPPTAERSTHSRRATETGAQRRDLVRNSDADEGLDTLRPPTLAERGGDGDGEPRKGVRALRLVANCFSGEY
jgi:hypothetical protein